MLCDLQNGGTAATEGWAEKFDGLADCVFDRGAAV
jgi:hypothetical protein